MKVEMGQIVSRKVLLLMDGRLILALFYILPQQRCLPAAVIVNLIIRSLQNIIGTDRNLTLALV